MQKDIRDTTLYREVEGLYQALHRPATGQISDAAEPNVSPDGRNVVFTGTLMDRLEGSFVTRVCRVDLTSNETRVLTFGPNVDRLPKYSPNGRHIAFLSDRHQAGDFQLHLLNLATGATRVTPSVTGWVEYLHWSTDGTRVLLGVAGHGADVAGAQGAITSKGRAEVAPAWTPSVATGQENNRWRRAWVYDLVSDSVRQISKPDCNVWEATWCGNEAIAAVVSPQPEEGLWYSARLHVIELETGDSREMFRPVDQLGWPAACASGKSLAVVEAVCSDRWLVAGELRLIDVASRNVRQVDTRGVDVTHVEWRSERTLLLAGHRGFETVVGLYDMSSASFTELWASVDVTTGGRYATVAGLNESGDCVLIGEGFVRAPEIAVIRQREYQPVRSFDLGSDLPQAIGAVQRISWNAADGLEIQGWLLRPKSDGPYPLVMNVHGGPVSHSRNRWLGRIGVPIVMLLRHGYAVFMPNPRGSSTRGLAYARHVVGDMGGADGRDCLSGLDHLVAQGLVDPRRIGVTGISYGGFMTAWLITQDARFAAAVAVAPMTNQVTEHLISNIPQFVQLFLQDAYTNPHGKYFQRSPIMHAHKVKTPTLSICGAQDRCTPPEEAMQFHHALREHGVESVLLTYPEEGHGIRKFPATIDYAARLVGWFEQHMPASAR